MKKLLFIPVLVALAVACGDDSPERPNIPPPTYKSLANKSDVLNNLQLAYNDRNVTEYEKILDDGFTFIFSDSDVKKGLPAQWGRTDEINANTNLFSPIEDPQDRWPLCTSIQMDVQFETSLQWVEVIPDAAPDETWYTTTLFYDFQIEVKADTRFLPFPGAKAEFTVRNAGTGEDPRWQVVAWQDLATGQSFGPQATASTETTTWGAVKWLWLPAGPSSP